MPSSGTAGAKDSTFANARKRRNIARSLGEVDTITWYFAEVQKHPALSHDESTELFKLLPEANTSTVETLSAEQKRVRTKLINSNLRLVISIAKGYRRAGSALEDLIQEGNIGLMKAIERFDWRKGYRFSTYASWWIKQAIGQHVLKRRKTIRMPAHAVGLQKRMISVAEEYRSEFGSEPSAAELAALLSTDEMKVSEKVIQATMQSGREILSLSSPVAAGSDMSTTLEETIADTSLRSNPFESVAENELINLTREVLKAKLTPKEAAILRLRFGIAEDPTDSASFPITVQELEKIVTEGKGLDDA